MNNPASRIVILPLTLGLLLPVVSLAALRAETPKLPVPAARTGTQVELVAV